VSSFDFWPEQNKVLQFDCIAEGVFMKEHLQKGALLVALGIVVIVGGFIFTAAVLGLWLNSIGNLAPQLRCGWCHAKRQGALSRRAGCRRAQNA
jgi:hypothetical protein